MLAGGFRWVGWLGGKCGGGDMFTEMLRIEEFQQFLAGF